MKLSDETGSYVNSPSLFGFGRTDSHLHQVSCAETAISWKTRPEDIIISAFSVKVQTLAYEFDP